MIEGEPFTIDALEEARKLFPFADVELHDGTLVVTPRADNVAHDVVHDLINSLLPHIEREDHGFWIEGSATVEFDESNSRFYALALWKIDPESVPAIVIHVMSAHEQLRWSRGRLNRAMELGVGHALLVDPATRCFLAFSGPDRSEVFTAGIPFPELLPNWSLDAATLFRA